MAGIGFGANTSEVIFEFLADETYHIAVAGKTASDVGNIVLNYEIIPEPVTFIFGLALAFACTRKWIKR